jgi:hypothetical protein
MSSIIEKVSVATAVLQVLWLSRVRFNQEVNYSMQQYK